MSRDRSIGNNYLICALHLCKAFYLIELLKNSADRITFMGVGLFYRSLNGARRSGVARRGTSEVGAAPLWSGGNARTALERAFETLLEAEPSPVENALAARRGDRGELNRPCALRSRSRRLAPSICPTGVPLIDSFPQEIPLPTAFSYPPPAP